MTSLLTVPVERTATTLASGFLQEAAQACDQLERGDDKQALHDFRVGLRRLRSTLRAYKPYVGKHFGKPIYRDIKRLAGSTGAARDSEVQLAWLGQCGKRIEPEDRAGFEYVCGRVRRRMDYEYQRLHASLPMRFEAARRQIDDRLRHPPHESHISYAEAGGRLIDQCAGTIYRYLEHFRQSGDETAAHRARLAVKQLRYLAEPLCRELDSAAELVTGSKKMQDLLGDIHDAYVFAHELIDAGGNLAAEGMRVELQTVLRLANGASPPALQNGNGPIGGLMAVAGQLQIHREGLLETLMTRLADGSIAESLDRARNLAWDLTHYVEVPLK
ncbi:MAG: CHAD domain-containing protein [Gammaproteobacteria bacterium]